MPLRLDGDAFLTQRVLDQATGIQGNHGHIVARGRREEFYLPFCSIPSSTS